MMDFSGKLVLITGSSRGIGRATARAFLKLGARVAINGRTERSVMAAIRELGGGDRLVQAPGDVGTLAGCKSAVKAAVDGLGALDVLVNSAGVCVSASIEDSDENLWDRTLDINLKGAFFCSQMALKALRLSRGVIVNVASDAGLLGERNLCVYCASKGGVVNLTRAMALELAPEVRVNCVCPGYVDTDMVRRDYIEKAQDPCTTEQRLKEFAPMKRIATPEEIGRAIVYLSSSHAGFITGAALQIDGGTTAGH
jgi:NAD(P)-dependent dehydrogenase (short-subunit alcohol dehydrogenase family)